jgi:hypothetical protein
LIEVFKHALRHHPADPNQIEATLADDAMHRASLVFGGLVNKRWSKLPRGVVDMYSAMLILNFYSSEKGVWDVDDFKLR